MGYFLIKGKDGKLSVKQRFAFLVSCSHSTCPPMLWYPMNLASGCLPSKGLFLKPLFLDGLSFAVYHCHLWLWNNVFIPWLLRHSRSNCSSQSVCPPNLASLCLAADSMFTFITRACLASPIPRWSEKTQKPTRNYVTVPDLVKESFPHSCHILTGGSASWQVLWQKERNLLTSLQIKVSFSFVALWFLGQRKTWNEERKKIYQARPDSYWAHLYLIHMDEDSCYL